MKSVSLKRLVENRYTDWGIELGLKDFDQDNMLQQLNLKPGDEVTITVCKK